jgi:hypothetical protein
MQKKEKMSLLFKKWNKIERIKIKLLEIKSKIDKTIARRILCVIKFPYIKF